MRKASTTPIHKYTTKKIVWFFKIFSTKKVTNYRSWLKIGSIWTVNYSSYYKYKQCLCLSVVSHTIEIVYTTVFTQITGNSESVFLQLVNSCAQGPPNRTHMLIPPSVEMLSHLLLFIQSSRFMMNELRFGKLFVLWKILCKYIWDLETLWDLLFLLLGIMAANLTISHFGGKWFWL